MVGTFCRLVNARTALLQCRQRNSGNSCTSYEACNGDFASGLLEVLTGIDQLFTYLAKQSPTPEAQHWYKPTQESVGEVKP